MCFVVMLVVRLMIARLLLCARFASFLCIQLMAARVCGVRSFSPSLPGRQKVGVCFKGLVRVSFNGFLAASVRWVCFLPAYLACGRVGVVVITSFSSHAV